MLQSYEAIYDHGRLTWTGEVPSWAQERVKVIVTVISEQVVTDLPDSGEKDGDLQPMRRDELHDRSCLR
ncbi:hypothetical protein [Candidatus Magnetaquicoccus inordinatus]|uniref:hypothetical protein n=1 Tax=Candidatus Magnetaquicoccus inordinatus TaxID=2496818 RepID=UPI00102B8862|nr:hypothetical protein [Candidatus Magnetaquicoccus inordinatus]